MAADYFFLSTLAPRADIHVYDNLDRSPGVTVVLGGAEIRMSAVQLHNLMAQVVGHSLTTVGPIRLGGFGGAEIEISGSLAEFKGARSRPRLHTDNTGGAA